MLLLAASSLSFGGFENNNFQYAFNDARRLGYERIEFNCWYAESLTPGRIREMRRRCEGTGLQPVALHVSAFGGSTSEQLSWNTAHKLRAIEAAVELGCRRVVASGMHIEDRDGERTGTNALLDDLLRELYNLAPYAEEADVLLCLENHCSNVLAGQQAYHYLFDRIDSAHVGICLDGGHLEAAGESIGEFIEAFAPRINHLHLKENGQFGRKSFCRFGCSGTDNDAMIREMIRRGYSGYMSVELSPEIGENGDFIPFTDEDRRKPHIMFSRYESI